MAGAISISKADLLNYAAQYRKSVEAQTGAATPYPDNRTDELDQIDRFSKAVQNHPSANTADMVSCEQAKAAKELSRGKAWDYGSMGASIALVGSYFVPALHMSGNIAGLGALAVLFIGQRVAEKHYSAFNRASNLVNDLQNYTAYAQNQAQPAPVPAPPQPAPAAPHAALVAS